MKYDVDGGILDGSKRWLSCNKYDFTFKDTCEYTISKRC